MQKLHGRERYEGPSYTPPQPTVLDEPERTAVAQINVMLDAIKRDARDYFGMGKMRASKKLANGARVVVTITMPAMPDKSNI